MNTVNQSQVAEIAGISKQSVAKAVAAGRCPTVTVDGNRCVDLDDPDVAAYIDKARAYKARRDEVAAEKANPKPGPPKRRGRPPKPKAPKVPKRRGRPPKSKEAAPKAQSKTSPAPPRPSAVEEWQNDPNAQNSFSAKTRKEIADAALKEVKLKAESAAYFERIGAFIDGETVRQKMAVFIDVLVTQLVYEADEVADSLWDRARAADDPPKAIREILSKQNAAIITKAKRAAAELEPPKAGRTYFVTDRDDE